MSEFQIRDQKLNKLRVEFLNIAGNEDGEVSWDSCGMYKKIVRLIK